MGKASCSPCLREFFVVVALFLAVGSSLSGGDASQETAEAALPRRPSFPRLLQESVGKVRRPQPPHLWPPEISVDRGAFPVIPPTHSLTTQSANRRPPHVFHVTDFGADPTGQNDSFQSISLAIAAAVEAFSSSPRRSLLAGIADLGGAEIHLDGGTYLLSRPLRLPPKIGNLKIHGGSLVAADDFPVNGYLIELSSGATAASTTVTSSSLEYEFITLKDLMLDANHRGGGAAIINSLRTAVDNCYIVRFTTDGILVRGGHETFIRSSFLGQKITAGADPDERNFSGVGINLAGNDNAVTDVVIFSGAVGVLVSGQANALTGIHCYNKASGFGGVGIYLRLPNLTQTRIINCYLDYTGIIAEDPAELLIMGCFFLGDGNIVLKSVAGAMKGVTVVGNMFSGSGNGVDVVVLDEGARKFTAVEQVEVGRNAVMGMKEKATSGKGLATGKGTSWTVDFSSLLLFPDRIESLQYTMAVGGGAGATAVPPPFATHAVRNVSGNMVVVESEVPVSATVYVAVDQFLGGSG